MGGKKKIVIDKRISFDELELALVRPRPTWVMPLFNDGDSLCAVWRSTGHSELDFDTLPAQIDSFG